ncbi:MAG: GDP-mannose 4,6-dehydratase [Bacilli bacterium]|jgi:nucleoside-diphosphate-sugar epimerase
MKVLITGAGGVVGSCLIEKLFNDGEDVLGTYFTPTTDISEINRSIRMAECDVRDESRVNRIITEFKPDVIYHLAAQSRPPVSWEKPLETMDINVGGTINIFECIRHLKERDKNFDPVIVVACSSAAYGETISKLPEGTLVSEHEEFMPLSPYAVSKAGQDYLSFQYNRNYGLKTIRARIFNTTGPKKLLDVTGDLTHRAVEAKQLGQKTIKVGNLSTIRAILDVRDLCSALILLSKKGIAGEAYNICSKTTIVMSDIIPIIEKVLKMKLNVEVDRSLLRPSDEKLYAGDITKLVKTTGWKQRYRYEDTVANCVAYWQNHLK